MLTTTRRILKADEVTVEDPLYLGLDPSGQSRETAAPCGSAGPSVRIAENQSDYVVIEVTCPCGQTTFLRCEYAQPAGGAVHTKTDAHEGDGVHGIPCA